VDDLAGVVLRSVGRARREIDVSRAEQEDRKGEFCGSMCCLDCRDWCWVGVSFAQRESTIVMMDVCVQTAMVWEFWICIFNR